MTLPQGPLDCTTVDYCAQKTMGLWLENHPPSTHRRQMFRRNVIIGTVVQSYDFSQICVTEVIVINVTLTAVKPFFGLWLWLDYVPHSSSHDYDFDLTTSAPQEVNTLTWIAVMTFLPFLAPVGRFFPFRPASYPKSREILHFFALKC